MNQKIINKSTKYLNSWLKLRYERLDIPGFVVAVSHKGRVIFNEAYGYSNLENNKKLNKDDIFRIASHSKTFTATAIMQLQEASLLLIDDPVAKYINWLQEHEDKRFQKVTIRQLLSHSAGVIRDGKNADYWQIFREFPDKNQFKEEFLEARLVFDNNIQMKYSNFGYTLLGLVIEAVSGLSYNNYVNKNIVDKLGLKNTGPEYSAKIDDKLVTGYTRLNINKKRLPIDNIDTKVMSSATGFFSNSADLCEYFTAQIVGSKKILSDESKKEMQRTQWRVNNTKENEEYGLGFGIKYVSGRRTFGHGGGFPGQKTISLCDPVNDLVVVVLTNCIDGDASSIAKGVLSVLDYFEKNTSERTRKKDLSNFEGRYINLWGMGDIVVTGDKVVCVYPDCWQPFWDPEELEYISNNTFKIKKANGYASEGEEIKFNINPDGKVGSVIYAGGTMLPESEWNKQILNKKQIGL